MNTGVAALAFDMARSKIELLARIIAEIGLKPLFHHMHELMIKHKYKAKAMRIRNKWVDSDPSQWRTRKDSQVQIGIGKASRERRIMAHEAILAKQQELVGQGAMGTLLQPHHIYQANKGWIEAWGFEPDLYLQDPRTLPPPPPKGPDPQAELAQAQSQALMMDGQSKMIRAENEKAKIAMDAKKLELETQYKQAEVFMKGEIERLRQQAAMLKSEMDTGGKVADLQSQMRAKETAAQIDAMKVQLDHLNKTRDRDLEYYKLVAEKPEPVEDEGAMLEAEEAKREAQARDHNRDATLAAVLQELRSLKESGPKVVEYDEKGLMKSIGGKPVVRDGSGRVRQIG
jgi:hypothetical protein